MEYNLASNEPIGILNLNSEKIITTKVIADELDSLLILANLLGYVIDYSRKTYGNSKKFSIIDIYLPNKSMLRLKISLLYNEELKENKIINICFIIMPDINIRNHNIQNTYEITDENIVKTISEFKRKL